MARRTLLPQLLLLLLTAAANGSNLRNSLRDVLSAAKGQEAEMQEGEAQETTKNTASKFAESVENQATAGFVHVHWPHGHNPHVHVPHGHNPHVHWPHGHKPHHHTCTWALHKCSKSSECCNNAKNCWGYGYSGFGYDHCQAGGRRKKIIGDNCRKGVEDNNCWNGNRRCNDCADRGYCWGNGVCMGGRECPAMAATTDPGKMVLEAIEACTKKVTLNLCSKECNSAVPKIKALAIQMVKEITDLASDTIKWVKELGETKIIENLGNAAKWIGDIIVQLTTEAMKPGGFGAMLARVTPTLDEINHVMGTAGTAIESMIPDDALFKVGVKAGAKFVIRAGLEYVWQGDALDLIGQAAGGSVQTTIDKFRAFSTQHAFSLGFGFILKINVDTGLEFPLTFAAAMQCELSVTFEWSETLTFQLKDDKFTVTLGEQKPNLTPKLDCEGVRASASIGVKIAKLNPTVSICYTTEICANIGVSLAYEVFGMSVELFEADKHLDDDRVLTSLATGRNMTIPESGFDGNSIDGMSLGFHTFLPKPELTITMSGLEGMAVDPETCKDVLEVSWSPKPEDWQLNGDSDVFWENVQAVQILSDKNHKLLKHLTFQEDVKNVNTDCWSKEKDKCNSKNAECGMCGADGACCRKPQSAKDSANGPTCAPQGSAVYDKVTGYGHVCVAKRPPWGGLSEVGASTRVRTEGQASLFSSEAAATKEVTVQGVVREPRAPSAFLEFERAVVRDRKVQRDYVEMVRSSKIFSQRSESLQRQQERARSLLERGEELHRSVSNFRNDEDGEVKGTYILPLLGDLRTAIETVIKKAKEALQAISNALKNIEDLPNLILGFALKAVEFVGEAAEGTAQAIIKGVNGGLKKAINPDYKTDKYLFRFNLIECLDLANNYTLFEHSFENIGGNSNSSGSIEIAIEDIAVDAYLYDFEIGQIEDGQISSALVDMASAVGTLIVSKLDNLLKIEKSLLEESRHEETRISTELQKAEESEGSALALLTEMDADSSSAASLEASLKRAHEQTGDIMVAIDMFVRDVEKGVKQIPVMFSKIDQLPQEIEKLALKAFDAIASVASDLGDAIVRLMQMDLVGTDPKTSLLRPICINPGACLSRLDPTNDKGITLYEFEFDPNLNYKVDPKGTARPTSAPTAAPTAAPTKAGALAELEGGVGVIGNTSRIYFGLEDFVGKICLSTLKIKGPDPKKFLDLAKKLIVGVVEGLIKLFRKIFTPGGGLLQIAEANAEEGIVEDVEAFGKTIADAVDDAVDFVKDIAKGDAASTEVGKFVIEALKLPKKIVDSIDLDKMMKDIEAGIPKIDQIGEWFEGAADHLSNLGALLKAILPQGITMAISLEAGMKFVAEASFAYRYDADGLELIEKAAKNPKISQAITKIRKFTLEKWVELSNPFFMKVEVTAGLGLPIAFELNAECRLEIAVNWKDKLTIDWDPNKANPLSATVQGNKPTLTVSPSCKKVMLSAFVGAEIQELKFSLAVCVGMSDDFCARIGAEVDWRLFGASAEVFYPPGDYINATTGTITSATSGREIAVQKNAFFVLNAHMLKPNVKIWWSTDYIFPSQSCGLQKGSTGGTLVEWPGDGEEECDANGDGVVTFAEGLKYAHCPFFEATYVNPGPNDPVRRKGSPAECRECKDGNVKTCNTKDEDCCATKATGSCGHGYQIKWLPVKDACWGPPNAHGANIAYKFECHKK